MLTSCSDCACLDEKYHTALKKNLVDLRTLDTMYNHEELKSELFNYLHRLTKGKKSHRCVEANPQGFNEIKEISIANNPGKNYSRQMIKFDIVSEYNRAVEYWYKKNNPSSTQVAMMCDFIADVMRWFSKNISRLTKMPPFLRENLDVCHLQKIGVDRFFDMNESHSTVSGTFEESPGTFIFSAGPKRCNKIEREQIRPENYYFLNRWIWIQVSSFV